MKKIAKYLIFMTLICISIGLAYLSANLGLNGHVSFKDNAWDVHFEKVKILDSKINNPLVTIEDDTSINISAEFSSPGDYLEFNFSVVNNGTIDATLDSIDNSLTKDLSEYIKVKLSYVYSDTEVKENDIVYSGQTRKIKARYEYNEDINQFINVDSTSFTISLQYIQAKNVQTTVWNYECVEDAQTFHVNKSGKYKIEAWGASGGLIDETNIGYGGYAKGVIELQKNDTLYIYVGGTPTGVEEGYNGGGEGIATEGMYKGGGGATDIRLVDGNWKDFSSLKSRIMVAAGGGGSGRYSTYGHFAGGSAGGLVGYEGGASQCKPTTPSHQHSSGGTQISGGTSETRGKGGYFGYSVHIATDHYGSGGGSGYYGGGSGFSTVCYVSSGAGGSSFISGHEGCKAISKDSTETNIIHTDNSIHYSGISFTDTVMVDGMGYNWTDEKGNYTGMPSPKSDMTISGNIGDGYARITYIG